MSAIRSAKGRMVDFENLRRDTVKRATQEADAGESSSLARPEDTYIPPEKAPRVATPKKPSTRNKKKNEADAASDILKDLDNS